MSITQSSTEGKSQPKQPKTRSRRYIGIVRVFSWMVTLAFLMALISALYQAFITRNPIPLWSWFGLVVLFAVAVGLGTAAVVYRGVVEQAGPLNFRASGPATGELVHESRRVETGQTISLRADIKMVEGTLQLMGGAAEVMDAGFTYDDADWNPPLVQHSVDPSGLGSLEVEQRATQRPAMRQGRCEWVIRLNGDLPTDLNIKFGVGKAELRLAGLALSRLRVESGVGALVVDLSGERRSSMEAFIKAGIGDTVLRLPQDAGVRIRTEASLGSTHAQDLTRDGEGYYVNAAYGQSPVTLDIVVETGMGRLTLE